MNDTAVVVRWKRKGRKGRTGTHRLTKYHVPIAIPSDAELQTACGIRVPRRDAEYGSAGDGVLCANCTRAMAVVPDPPDIAA